MILSVAKESLPLYIQIKEWLVGKISKGEWLPGKIIPSEIQLAQELEVSQGTVRKAITELVEHNVLTRKQGKGTFVANHDTQRTLFHFFHIADNEGHKVLPESVTLSCRRKRASRQEGKKLQLPDDSIVVCIERVRKFAGKPTVLESITLPGKLFGSLDKKGASELPNALYKLYEEQFGVTIHSAKEQLRAVGASKRTATLLELPPGTPLLEVERIALTLDKIPIELRISRCSTHKHHYQNTLF